MEGNRDHHVPDVDDLFTALHAGAKAVPGGGVTELARRYVMKPKTLLNYLDPQDITHYPSSPLFLRVLCDIKDKTAVDIICQMNGGTFKTKTSETHDSISSAIVNAFTEVSDVARLVDEFKKNDGVLDSKEKHRIRIEIAEAEHAISVLKNTLQMES